MTHTDNQSYQDGFAKGYSAGLEDGFRDARVGYTPLEKYHKDMNALKESLLALAQHPQWETYETPDSDPS